MPDRTEDPRYVTVPLAVFAALAERLALCPSAPPFAAIETTTADGQHYGAMLAGGCVRIVATAQPGATVGDVLRAPPIAIARLAKAQRSLLYDALSAWYVGRLARAGIIEQIDA